MIVFSIILERLWPTMFNALHKAGSCKNSKHKKSPVHHSLVKEPGEIMKKKTTKWGQTVPAKYVDILNIIEWLPSKKVGINNKALTLAGFVEHICPLTAVWHKFLCKNCCLKLSPAFSWVCDRFFWNAACMFSAKIGKARQNSQYTLELEISAGQLSNKG